MNLLVALRTDRTPTIRFQGRATAILRRAVRCRWRGVAERQARPPSRTMRSALLPMVSSRERAPSRGSREPIEGGATAFPEPVARLVKVPEVSAVYASTPQGAAIPRRRCAGETASRFR